MKNNYFDILFQMFEFEYLSFLSGQREYDFNVRYDENIIKLSMLRISSRNDIPETIDCIFSFSNGISYIIINDITFEYKENILQEYISNYTTNNIIEDINVNKINKAAILLGITPDNIFNDKLIKENYRKVISCLHPDKWISENDSDIINFANNIVIKMTEARDILIENLKGVYYET